MFSTIAAVCCLAALGTAVGYSPLPGICKGEVRSAAARRRGAAPPAARPSRRSLLSGAAAAALFTAVGPAVAVGPKEIALDNLTWRSTQDGVAKPMCNGRPLKVPGEKVAEGMTPKCIRVTTQATNGGKVAVKDASVFGYVRLDSGGSAIANNPDFKSDAGQFAMIPDVPAGTNQVEFEFVAVIPKEQEKYDMEFDKVGWWLRRCVCCHRRSPSPSPRPAPPSLPPLADPSPTSRSRPSRTPAGRGTRPSPSAT
jgi:hypothetical protein